MNTQEMHITLDGLYQSLNVAVRRNFLLEQKDEILQQVTEQFIRDRIKVEKYGASLLNEYDLRTLVPPAFESVAWLGETSTNRQMYEANLPPACFQILGHEILLERTCGATPVSTTRTHYEARIPVRLSARGTAPYYTPFSITGGNVSFSLSAMATNNNEVYAGYQSKKELFNVTRILESELWKNKAWWEWYGQSLDKNTLVIYSESAQTYTLVTDQTTTTHPATAINRTINVLANGYPETAPLRVVSHREIQEMMHTPFWRTGADSPLGMISLHSVFVVGDDSFIVKAVRTEYVRKPKQISLILGNNCDLPPHTHVMICELAAAKMALLSNDERTPLLNQTANTHQTT